VLRQVHPARPYLGPYLIPLSHPLPRRVLRQVTTDRAILDCPSHALLSSARPSLICLSFSSMCALRRYGQTGW
jgi:hypothetical protein